MRMGYTRIGDVLKVSNADFYSGVAKAGRRVAPRNREAGKVGFGKVKDGSGLSAHSGGSVILDVLGCASCGWCETVMCPHHGGVTRRKLHSNRICGERVRLGVMLSEDGHKITFKKLLWLKQAVEAEKISQHQTKEAMEGRVPFRDVYPWKKLVAETMAQFIKQEEGSKVRVERKMSPADLADLLDDARVVDGEVEKDGG